MSCHDSFLCEWRSRLSMEHVSIFHHGEERPASRSIESIQSTKRENSSWEDARRRRAATAAPRSVQGRLDGRLHPTQSSDGITGRGETGPPWATRRPKGPVDQVSDTREEDTRPGRRPFSLAYMKTRWSGQVPARADNKGPTKTLPARTGLPGAAPAPDRRGGRAGREGGRVQKDGPSLSTRRFWVSAKTLSGSFVASILMTRACLS